MSGICLYGIRTVGAKASETSQPQPRLVKAAIEFEAQMMQELLKPLTANEDNQEGGALTGSTDSLQSFASEALGSALARHGGFGIATGIVRELAASGPDAKN